MEEKKSTFAIITHVHTLSSILLSRLRTSSCAKEHTSPTPTTSTVKLRKKSTISIDLWRREKQSTIGVTRGLKSSSNKYAYNNDKRVHWKLRLSTYWYMNLYLWRKMNYKLWTDLLYILIYLLWNTRKQKFLHTL